MTKKSKKLLLLVDASALIHRAYHALPPLTSPSGQLTNAVYGFTSALLSAFKNLEPSHVVVAFDAPGKTFRDEFYEEYKATRPATAEDLSAQFPLARKVIEALEIPGEEVQGFEADDLIAALATQAEKKNFSVAILTGDLDALQLVSAKTKVVMMSRGPIAQVEYTESAIADRYHLKPEQLIDYKALHGDPSDNIPGVKGIGEKTTINLLQKYNTVDNLYTRLDDLPEKTRKLLEEGKESAFMSKRLAALAKDAPVTFKEREAHIHDYNKEGTVRIFKELGFNSLISRLPESTRVNAQESLFRS